MPTKVYLLIHMRVLKLILFFYIFLQSQFSFGQITDSTSTIKQELDSLYILEVEGLKASDKVLHAEPLFIDLIRDLGARKGEKEWNVGLGLTDQINYDQYTTLVEYEFAPIDRLGLEFELPFTFYYQNNKDSINKPSSKLNGLKLAAQYSFYVSEKRSTSLALGYIHEFKMVDFNQYQKQTLFNGSLFNPFLIAAKRWGNNFHTLIYQGPIFEKNKFNNTYNMEWQFNTNVHYMISGTRNFIGIEFNKEFRNKDFDMTIRPQMRVAISDKMMIGIVTGIPIKRETQRMSTFLRLIYEPGHQNTPKHLKKR